MPPIIPIPVTVLADAAAASLMHRGRVDLVIVGADRIAAIVNDRGIHRPPYSFA